MFNLGSILLLLHVKNLYIVHSFSKVILYSDDTTIIFSAKLLNDLNLIARYALLIYIN